jgi:two-component system, sensor histidine kinase PdtaS
MKVIALFIALLGLDNEAILVGGLLVFALLTLCIDRYRIIKQSKEQLYQQKQALDHKLLELEHVHLSRTKLLAEKEWLLKEIHHRVKNSLQVAISLLNTQSHYLENEKAPAALRQCRNRMYAMSIIHQRLYQSDNLELIQMNRYIPELIKYIGESFAEDRHLHFRLHIDAVRLDVDQAVPIGLIINEAVTNSIKYAFPDRNDGVIDISLQDLRDKGLRLEIADDGIGLREDLGIKRVRSIGMELIDSLKLQLEGRMTISNKGGTAICIIFLRASERHDPLAAPVFEK